MRRVRPCLRRCGRRARLRPLLGAAHDPLIGRLARFLDASITAHGAQLDARGRRGRIRDGHGDLRAEQVLLSPELAIIDCLEFDPVLRTLDTAEARSARLAEVSAEVSRGLVEAMESIRDVLSRQSA